MANTTALKLAKKVMYQEVLEQIGLAKNEARIYETLLKEGKSGVSKISLKSGVHRRNCYDTLNRLIEKGLVFELVEKLENKYQAVKPSKLSELIQEKQTSLNKIMPDLEKLFVTPGVEQRVAIYRGAEGWKNYLQDILDVGRDAYFIGAKGGWLDERVQHFLPKFVKQAEQQGIQYYHLFDAEVADQCPEIMPIVGDCYKFLPAGYSTSAAIDIFGDQVNIISGMEIGCLQEEFSVTVIVNPLIAEAFRTWFKLMWDLV